MKHAFTHHCAAALFATTLLTSALCNAQPSPSTEQMIEQLKAPKTRSLNGAADTRSFGVVDRSKEAVPAALAAAPSKPSQTVAPSFERASVSLQIQFEFGSATVSASSQTALKNLAQALNSKDLSTAKFLIEGHTDAQGRADLNQKLSAQRAGAVKHYLLAQGVSASRLTAEGRGSEEPANATDPSAAENRRVKIINLD